MLKDENVYKGHYFEASDSVLAVISALLKRFSVSSVFRISPINSLRKTVGILKKKKSQNQYMKGKSVLEIRIRKY